MLLLTLIFAFAGAQTAWAFKAETTDYTINCSNTGIRISGGGSQTDTWIATNGYWVANDSHNLANGITVKPNANVRCQNGSLQTLSSTTFTFTAPSNGNIAITNVVFKSAQNEVSATSHSEPGTTYTVTLASSTYFNGFTLTFGYIKGDCGTNAKWELSKQNGQYTALTISGSGAMNNYGHDNADIWHTNAPWGYDLTSVTIGNSITSIGDYAFIGCQSLASITIGTGVTTIGTNAFDHCDAMTSVTLPASVTSLNQGAFKNCVNLERIDIGHDGAVSLAANVFQNDNALQYIVFSSPTAALTNTTGNWSGLASKLRVALGDKLFTATNQGGTDAYAITNETDLRNLATAVNGHGHSESIANGKTFRQTGNITLSSTNFEPISIYSEDFLGATYDGGDYTISGLNVSTLTGIDNYGLFGYVKNATVKNIRLVNPTVNVNAAYYGALIGETNHATVENCVVINPTIQGSNTKRGAIIGRIDNSTLQNLYFCDGNYNDAIGFVHSGSSGTNVARARKVTLGSGIASVTPAATDMDNGFVYNNKRYYREGLELTLTTNLSEQGYHIIYKAGSNTLTGNTYTVNSTDGDVTLTAEQMITTYTITLADAADNSSTIREWNGSVAEVTLQGRTLTKNNEWNTLCLPFSMTAAQIAASPLAGATIKEMATTSNLDANGVLTLNFSTVTAIEAGKPYIIKWTTTGDNIVNPTFSGVTISSTTPTAVESYDHTVTFVGQYSPFSIVESGATGDNEGNKNEILLMTKGNKIGYSKNPRTLNCFRCHFYVPTNGGQQAHSIEVDFGEGEATALSEELRVKSEDVYYTLDGRKLEGKPTAKGMYIVNGRKVIIK